ncbi:GHKL domain-containing protein [Pseudoflavitalea sp. G-6-1-2]|uniref:sensor histidine kinase n=1 Tax=Pseudoflavitalea sp. G-6-1-2 TaxID=2728841 RepID=UPI00146C5D0D|nr:ATP-binding protein [Pseudoflavitalea sp. G-6-1-2]NML22040.1 GHKL domain-containing protein [Pseudoflavitalea sp. G-6-1-2]
MKISVLTFISILLLPFLLPAQDSLQYNIRHYTDENGLPQNSVKSIAHDRSGFLWMSTENGLVRFDGLNFRTFNKNRLALKSSRITWLFPDLVANGLYAMNENNETIYMQDGRASKYDGEPPSNIVVTKMLTYYDEYQATGLPNLYAEVITTKRYHVSATPAEQFWIDNASVKFFRNKKEQYTIPFLSEDFWHFFLAGNRLYHLHNRELTLFENGKAINAGTLQGDIISSKYPVKIYWNQSANQLFLASGNALFLVKPGINNGLTTQLLLNDFNFEENSILAVYYDEKFRRLFMGSHTRGLFVLTRKPFFTLRAGFSKKDEVYYSQAPFSDNSVITPQGIVLGLNRKAAILPEINKRSINDNFGMVVDRNKNIWVKGREKLWQFDAAGKKLLREMNFDSYILMMLEGKSGELIIGLRNNSVVSLKSTPGADPVPVKSTVQNVLYLQEEGDDKLWMATEHGLYCCNRRTGQLDSIPELSGKYIRSLYVRQPGELWITTNEDGFFLYDGSKLTRFPQDRFNFLASTHCIVEDDNGFFWITTNKGLFLMQRKDLLEYAAGRQSDAYYLYFDKYSGFNTNEFNGGCQPCGLKLGNGLLSFPSLNGLVQTWSGKLIPEVPEKDLFIDRVEIDGKEIEPSDTISLDKHFDFFKLYVTTPYFGNPQNTQLYFSLMKDHHEAAWIAVDNDRSIKLSSLTSGTYQIRIRKSNGFGAQNRRVRVVTLIVPLQFYETTWFKILTGLLVVAGFFLYMRIKLGYIKRKNAQLEEKIDERTQALQTTLNELQQSEESLRKQTRIQHRLITAISHDIKTPLKFLTDIARRAYQSKPEELGADELRRSAHLIYDSGHRMYHLTDNLLQFIRLNSEDRKFNFDTISLYDLVQSKLQLFREIAADQSTSIENRIVAPFSMMNNHHLLGIVLHNLIDNAVKATYNGSIRIDAERDEQEIIIRVEDTGFGMNDEMKQWCNDESTIKGNASAGSTGFGLIIVKDLVELMHGIIRVSSQENKGTLIELHFPDLEQL